MHPSVILSATLLSLWLWTSAQALAQGSRFSDQDWTVTLKDNCGLPRQDSIALVRVSGDRKLRVTLAPGDVGRCSTDNKRRHRAPFWERAELAQVSKMPLGQRHRISAEVTFLEGFTGDRESFLQIHGWDRECRAAYPPLMFKFHDGSLRIDALRGATAGQSGRHRNLFGGTLRIDQLYGRPMEMVIDFDTRSKPGTFSVTLGGTTLVQRAPVDFAPCATPTLKLGVYRPGGKGSETSSVLFDDIRVEHLR